MRRVPRQPLDRAFVRAVRASSHSLVTLAALSNFASYTQLSALLNAPRVRASALNIERLRALAVVIAYDGPLFKAVTR
jgi:hypothetical protein